MTFSEHTFEGEGAIVYDHLSGLGLSFPKWEEMQRPPGYYNPTDGPAGVRALVMPSEGERDVVIRDIATGEEISRRPAPLGEWFDIEVGPNQKVTFESKEDKTSGEG